MSTPGAVYRARVNTSSPEAWAVCDLCGFIFNHVDLRFQYAWRGNNLQNTFRLRCTSCWDEPFQLNRPRILPPDPEPVLNARPPQWTTQMAQNPGPHSADPDPIQQAIATDTVP